MKALIADDDSEIVRTLEIALRAAGFHVCTADDALRAFERAKKELPDLILLDIAMPQGSGLDVLRLLKESPLTQHIPVIVISASSDPQIPEKVKTLGAADYIAKPFEMTRIRAAVAKLAGIDLEGKTLP